ncbi:hypothetical protein QYE76_042779 [Lolium multiflorum]|uniref:Arabidopsis retrotransposon Orf1 C-terminal domain-containing protein n=1 Tax=Lolium multiflorum TaxID=4521 RepID=A0AAD8WXA8_LOLMU|nr:hypothetical protein QYE76_042779 [Lolium multiflorum]
MAVSGRFTASWSAWRWKQGLGSTEQLGRRRGRARLGRTPCTLCRARARPGRVWAPRVWLVWCTSRGLVSSDSGRWGNRMARWCMVGKARNRVGMVGVMPCHGMAWLCPSGDATVPFLVRVFGNVWRVKGSTMAELSLMVDARIHWILQCMRLKIVAGKYMKDIVTNKRKIPNEEISTMLANYSFNGKIPKKLGDPDKLIPTDISLQMADKSTAIPVGLCENVPVQVTQHCLILTDFVVLEMPEDDNMSIILGRPFLNTAGAVIDCNKGMVTFNVDDKEHTVYFPKRIDKKRKMKKFKFGELFKKGTTSTGRPSRASTQIRRSYNEDVIAPSFAPEEDNGAPNASSFPCYDFLTNAGILDDFFTLVNRAGLATYVGDEREQYYRLTKIFVESFKFHNTQYEPTVAFKIYDNPVTMELEEFCRALDIAPVGTARRIDDNPRDLLELYRGITEDDCRTIQRGKIRNIQLPAIKYFAYYIATSILGRENTSNISSYHLAFLNAALTGETSYHLGSLIARRLSSRGPIFGGTIALRILTHLRLPLDSNDVPLTPRRLDIAAMKSHHFVTTNSTIDNMVYRMLFADGNEKEIPLPQPGLFSIDRQSWSLTKEEVEEHMKIQEFHQQHDSENAEPSYDCTVTYPDVSSSTYLEPGRSSSYYGDTTSWGPWE